MRFAHGMRYEVRNVVTKEWAPFEVLEVGYHQGQVIVYGQLNTHGIWLPTVPSVGHSDVKPRASALVIVPDSTAMEVAQFCLSVGGLPLAIDDPPNNDRIFIVNTPTMPGWWAKGEQRKDKILDHAAKVINLWTDYVKLGKVVPVWYRDLRDAAAGMQRI